MGELLYATQVIADQEVIRSLNADALEDFGDAVLLTKHEPYIERVYPALVQRANALAQQERKEKPNDIGVKEAQLIAARLTDEWTKRYLAALADDTRHQETRTMMDHHDDFDGTPRTVMRKLAPRANTRRPSNSRAPSPRNARV